jgi:WXG100 family type VII secretion target
MPNADLLRVHFESLEDGARAMHAAMVSMEAKLVDMANRLQPMVETWNGDAQAAYYENQEQWKKAASDLNDIGMMFSQKVIASRNIMWDTEMAAVALQRSYNV